MLNRLMYDCEEVDGKLVPSGVRVSFSRNEARQICDELDTVFGGPDATRSQKLDKLWFILNNASP